MRRLLSVDWDYFFPVLEKSDPKGLYDWGRGDAPFYRSVLIWATRAALFKRAGVPLPGTSGEELTFWSRVTLAPNTPLWYADSHAMITHAVQELAPQEIINIDAHHDGGYHNGVEMLDDFAKGIIRCDNWAAFYQASGIDVTTLYPRWRAHAMQYEPRPKVLGAKRFVDNPENSLGKFDGVFVCKSEAWTPPWIDANWLRFITKAPTDNRVCLDKVGVRKWREDIVTILESQDAEIRKSILEQAEGTSSSFPGHPIDIDEVSSSQRRRPKPRRR